MARHHLHRKVWITFFLLTISLQCFVHASDRPVVLGGLDFGHYDPNSNCIGRCAAWNLCLVVNIIWFWTGICGEMPRGCKCLPTAAN
ncbi:hypothetical protein BV898_11448 [Hypsibius exemplaris]|uniref:Uncharacterized protein n=1 Tax=Hypsibius exemplaris TaxID=2072580 RepID=A0A1W0WGK3_HYPEX|nr:hypothetical protein BV898_11448 [Hypsibius exemplaris]